MNKSFVAAPDSDDESEQEFSSKESAIELDPYCGEEFVEEDDEDGGETKDDNANPDRAHDDKDTASTCTGLQAERSPVRHITTRETETQCSAVTASTALLSLSAEKASFINSEAFGNAFNLMEIEKERKHVQEMVVKQISHGGLFGACKFLRRECEYDAKSKFFRKIMDKCFEKRSKWRGRADVLHSRYGLFCKGILNRKRNNVIGAMKDKFKGKVAAILVHFHRWSHGN